LPSADLSASSEPSNRGNVVTLYSYFRSSAAFRARIALNLKGLPYQTTAIHLTKDGGQQSSPAFRAINPQMRVPAMKLPDGEILLQSLAIIEYLDELHPQPRLLPADAVQRARVRAVAQIIACDIHPLNNTASLNYLRRTLKVDEAAVNAWYGHWVVAGFDAVEALLVPGPYAFGADVGLADICLVPQVYNARRFKIPLERYPKIVAVDAACAKLAAFEKARPENQPDAE
jgi:maleylacetoacetate isomerase